MISKYLGKHYNGYVKDIEHTTYLLGISDAKKPLHIFSQFSKARPKRNPKDFVIIGNMKIKLQLEMTQVHFFLSDSNIKNQAGLSHLLFRSIIV